MNRQLRDAAHHLRVLYAVELAHATGDRKKIASLLSGVDPVEVMTLAVTLGALATVIPEPAETEPHVALPEDTSPPQARGSSDPDPTSVSAVVYPKVWHAGDNWSVKA